MTESKGTVMVIPDKETIEAWHKGDPISDAQLSTLLAFFKQMEAGCRAMGPKFDLAAVAFTHHNISAQQISWARAHN